ncbi:MAG: gamma-glutamyltransferase, partial [Pseudomonadota bacterium]
DPDHHDMPTELLLADETLDELASRIDPSTRTPDLGPVPRPGGSNTIYLSVVDANGMAVSFINSVYSSFGSCIAAPKSGVVFNNRAQGFVLDAGHPNVIAGGKRPMHTLAPGLVMRGGAPALSFGVMGADFQPMGQVYALSNMLHFGMDVQEALDAPRIFFEAPPAGVLGAEVGIPVETLEALRAMGHDVQVRSEPWGGGQAVQIAATPDVPSGRLLFGGSDPRKDGCAIGY